MLPPLARASWMVTLPLTPIVRTDTRRSLTDAPGSAILSQAAALVGLASDAAFVAVVPSVASARLLDPAEALQAADVFAQSERSRFMS
jgi:hypothetical protein